MIKVIPLLDENKLKAAFQKVLRLAPDTDFNILVFARTEGWDSIAHMQLIAAIETAYDIMLSTPDVLGLSSYPIAKTIVEKYVVNTSK